MRLSTVVLLGCLALLGGCRSSAETYVRDNSTGYFSVKGTLLEIEGLHSSKWEDLSDGFVLTVDRPGCEVVVQQGENKRSQFRMQQGDRIVHGYDSDYLLSSLTPDEAMSRGGASKAPPAAAPAAAVEAKPAKQPAKKAPEEDVGQAEGEGEDGGAAGD